MLKSSSLSGNDCLGAKILNTPLTEEIFLAILAPSQEKRRVHCHSQYTSGIFGVEVQTLECALAF